MSFLIGTLCFVLLSVSLFMILLVLIQRGRGGGLAGAFGGMGGQSAFGTRAGDTFTRITIVLAVIWVLLAGGIGMLMRREAEAAKTGANSAFIKGKDSDAKDEEDSTNDEVIPDSEKMIDFAADQKSEKSKAIGTLPPEEKKTDDAAPKAESEATEPATPDEKTAPPADETATPDASPTDDAATPDADAARATEEKASSEVPVESDPSKDASAEPEPPGAAPLSSDPKP